MQYVQYDTTLLWLLSILFLFNIGQTDTWKIVQSQLFIQNWKPLAFFYFFFHELL